MSAKIPFEADKTYHLYNHAVSDEYLFRSDENYRYFLSKYQRYTKHILDTYAYCLMPNHYHFLIKIRTYDDLRRFFQKRTAGPKSFSQKSLSKLLGQQIGNFLNAYTKAFNKRYGRKGRLFMGAMQRKRIEENAYLLNLIKYIHLNPVQHGFVDAPQEWPFSSYESCCGNGKSFVSLKPVTNWFGGAEAFVGAHQSAASRLIVENDFDI